jgi:hypothetical protein
MYDLGLHNKRTAAVLNGAFMVTDPREEEEVGFNYFLSFTLDTAPKIT